MVALRHRADLRDRLVAFVDEEQGVVGQIFEQRRRRLAGQAAGEETAVILDPLAASGRGDHLEVEMGALFQSLRLEQPALGLQFLESLDEFVPYRLDRKSTRLNSSHKCATSMPSSY